MVVICYCYCIISMFLFLLSLVHRVVIADVIVDVQDLNNSMSSLPAAMAALTAVKVWAYRVSLGHICCDVNYEWWTHSKLAS